MGVLCYRAGSRALKRLHSEGFGPGQVQLLVAPAVGPKWLAVAGLDQALIAGGYLGQVAPAAVLGASAGAWRGFAHMSQDPALTHRRLQEAYIAQTFSHADVAGTISQAYRTLLARVFEDDDVEHALSHPRLDLAVVVARARLGTGSPVRPIQAAALIAAGLANSLSPRTRRFFFERTLFHTGMGPDSMLRRLNGRPVPMTTDNARTVLLASGSVPWVMAPQRQLEPAAPGAYLDGGVTDYHLAQPLDCGDRGVALLLLHQQRIIPAWFDKYLSHRRPPKHWLQDVLLVYPEPSWVAQLPGGQVPTREDFTTFVDRPQERMSRWREAALRSEALGAQLLADAEAGRIPELTKPL